MRLAFVAVSLAALTGMRAVRGTVAADRIAANDNRVSAGELRNNVLTVRLEARMGAWFPDAESGPGVQARAFGEVGKALMAPGPVIRAPEGTELHAFVTNKLAEPMVLRGFSTRGAPGADSTAIAPGETHEFRFIAGKAGTYYYSATAGGRAQYNGLDAQLVGAFIVDPKGAPRVAKDRIFILSLWLLKLPRDTGPQAARFTINGKSWPNTEHLAFTVGDTVRGRVINVSPAVHPMHLHGFFYDVVSRGDGQVDSSRAAGDPPDFVVTERTTPGHTYAFTWLPERAGNWLFHCHDNLHVTRNQPLDGTRLPPEHLVTITNHAHDMMGGLVMGITVTARKPSPPVTLASAPRRLRLVAQQDSGGTELAPAFGYVLFDGAKHSSSANPLLPGPTIVVKRGEPVSITVVNQLSEATAVHWHGIELDSYYDGVAGFSGAGQHISPAIAAHDSFEVRFTPPRSGTFMYHPHADEVRQQQAGLTGALLVVDDPAKYDPTHDFVFLLTVPRRPEDGAQIYINGSLTPAPLEMKAGDRYRLRIVDLHTYRPSMIARFVRDSSTTTWTPIAKDGMDLPAQRRAPRTALQQLGNGESYDFEVRPAEPGNYRFTVTSATQAPLGEVRITVRAAP